MVPDMEKVRKQYPNTSNRDQMFSFVLMFCSCERSDIEMNSDHYYERKLVYNITTEGGMTKIPSKEMLKDFVNK